MTPAQVRAALILEVRSGRLTAREAARQMGISRKSYYQWEGRALEAMVQALEPQAPGRPRTIPDPEKEQLQARVQELEEQLQTRQEQERLRQKILEWTEKKTRDDPALPG